MGILRHIIESFTSFELFVISNGRIINSRPCRVQGDGNNGGGRRLGSKNLFTNGLNLGKLMSPISKGVSCMKLAMVIAVYLLD